MVYTNEIMHTEFEWLGVRVVLAQEGHSKALLINNKELKTTDIY